MDAPAHRPDWNGPEAYPRLPSRLDPRSEAARRNREAHLRRIERLGEALRQAAAGGGARYVARHRERGRLLVRERIELLLDPGSPFLELCPLAGHGVEGERTGAGIVGGIGFVSGTECLVLANDPTVKGGAITPLGLAKMDRLADVARENRLPTVQLVESAGADLPNQARIFVPGGRGFREIARRSRMGIPSVCLVFGSSTAGGAYIPGTSDYVVMVRRQAQVYLAGPPLVEMATGERPDAEALGGAEMHTAVSGVGDLLAEDERHALRLGRQLVASLHWRKEGPGPERPPEPPAHDPEELLDVVPADVREPMPVREVLARLLDGSRFLEFKARYGPTLVCGFGHVHGFRVGVLASEGVLFPESADKGAQFVQLCGQRGTPLLFLQHVTGFMVGERVERAGIVKAGARLINAISNAPVPAVTLLVGASYGAGNYALMGRAYEPRFLFGWPHHRIAVMGGRQLAGVLEIVQRQAAARRGEAVDEARLAAGREAIERQVESESDAFYASARLWDDGLVDPRRSREVLALALSAIHSAPVRSGMAYGVFRH